MLALYRAPFSTNVERVALALAFKGLEVESVVISYDDRSEVERVSGQPLVPVLVDEDDGLVVSGSMQIVAHLERVRAAPPLYPSDPARRAELEIFVDWFDRVWKLAPNAIAAELGSAAPDARRIAGLGASMAGALERFEALLAGREHLLGDAFSAADCAAFPFLKFALRREEADDELLHRVLEEHQRLGDDHPRLAAWIARVDARPRA
jgi:maleylacetoacetate isomerase